MKYINKLEMALPRMRLTDLGVFYVSWKDFAGFINDLRDTYEFNEDMLVMDKDKNVYYRDNKRNITLGTKITENKL